MKNISYSAIAIALSLFAAGCADKEPAHTSTTTTEQTEVRQPVTPVQQTTTTETRAAY
jgi:type IV pilus biogenesis protein CpaD/CtpE